MHALIDGDIIRYEVGYAAETGWGGGGPPSWEYTLKKLDERIDRIVHGSGSDTYSIYLTQGKNFRDYLARTEPYKGTRNKNKPHHFNNLTAYLSIQPETIIVRGIEADDAMSIRHVADPDTIICSRDKDLRQVPGWHYTWELGDQPSYGPVCITTAGNLWLNERGDLKGTGLAFFYAQCLTGDTVDNVPGCQGCGKDRAYKLLNGKSTREQLEAVIGAYRKRYGDSWKQHLTEQGRLLWMTRRMAVDYIGASHPVMWKIGMTE